MSYNIINDISFDKFGDLILQENYSPYIINRVLSQHLDCILPINFCNIHKDMNNELHYKYLGNSIKKRKRYFKKYKNKDNDFLAKITKTYKIGLKEAQIYSNILTEDEKKKIESEIE